MPSNATHVWRCDHGKIVLAPTGRSLIGQAMSFLCQNCQAFRKGAPPAVPGPTGIKQPARDICACRVVDSAVFPSPADRAVTLTVTRYRADAF